MAGLTLGGLASGMDTNTIITQLMAIEAQGKTRLARPAVPHRGPQDRPGPDRDASCARSKTATEDLRSVATWKTVQTRHLVGRRPRSPPRFKDGAAIGIYSIEVTQLARAEQRFFTYGDADPAATTINLKTTADPLDATQGDPPTRHQRHDPGRRRRQRRGRRDQRQVRLARVRVGRRRPARALGQEDRPAALRHRQPAHRGHRASCRAFTQAEYTIDGGAADRVRVEHRHRPAPASS